MSQHRINDNPSSFNTTNSFNNVWNNCTVADEVSEIWPGYLHLNPGYGTRTFGPVGSTRWETGSYKPGNTGTGLMVFVGVNLMVRPCFAMEIRGLVRPILGKREDTRGKKDTANKV